MAQLFLPGLLAAPGERQEPLVEAGVVAATVSQEGVPVPQVLVELPAALHAAGEPGNQVLRLQASKASDPVSLGFSAAVLHSGKLGGECRTSDGKAVVAAL